jgi:hypothetical protein
MKNALLLSLVVIALSSCGQEGDGNLASDPSLPEYIVADRVNLMVGGIYGDVVVPSLSSSVSLAELAALADAIAASEGFTQLSLYCSEEAVRANFSRSFLEENPNAYDCVLGSWEDGVFTPTPD